MRSPYASWRQHFLHNRAPDHCFRSLPWDHSYRLTDLERDLVAGPIQQFQLGEFARGRGFRRRAATSPIFADPCFLEALDLFIAEEQDHSEILGRFLDREGIPRLEHHWLDRIFRRLRKLAGLELCSMVLVTAEVLAIPFYQALRDATQATGLKPQTEFTIGQITLTRYVAVVRVYVSRKHLRTAPGYVQKLLSEKEIETHVAEGRAHFELRGKGPAPEDEEKDGKPATGKKGKKD